MIPTQIPVGMMNVPVDVDTPRWDQSAFKGRYNHFVRIVNPLLSLKTTSDLSNARTLIEQARQGYVPAGTTIEDINRAKVLYDSAFHPDSGDEMNVIGRMSFQVPGGTLITAGILVFYKTPLQILMAQFCNQSFNALVNYTNRNAKNHISDRQMFKAYIGAITGAVSVSILLNNLMKKAPPILMRWVPFVAVASANCINISTVRQREIIEGIVILDENGNPLGRSKKAAITSITKVVCSRVTMTIPTLLVLPVIMTRLEKRYPVLLRNRLASIIVQTVFCGLLLSFSVPVGCSLFPQRSSLPFNKLEKNVQDEIRSNRTHIQIPNTVYFNKGL